MRRRITTLALVMVAALASVLATTTPAHATLTLRIIYHELPEHICNSFGQSGEQTGRWQVWWCSQHYPQTYPGYVTYDMWAYVD